jgi:hypothetical protein
MQLASVQAPAIMAGIDVPEISAATDQYVTTLRDALLEQGVELDDPQVLFSVVMAGIMIARDTCVFAKMGTDFEILESMQAVALARLGSMATGEQPQIE